MDKNPRSQNQNNMDLRANKSKAVQCMQYKMGNCSFGKNCRYAHVNGPNSNISKYDADKCRSDGVCIVPKCRNRADEYKNDGVCIVPKCRKFWNGEFCAFGKNCYFLHDEPAATKMGFWKTRVCYKWEETGSCPYGRVCCYAHGRDELLKSRSQFDVQHEVNSNSRKRSATAAPREPYSGTANVPVSGQDKKKYSFNSDKKIKGIYADWIDETPYEPEFGMNLGSVCVTNNVC